jgi:hypothetical protein
MTAFVDAVLPKEIAMLLPLQGYSRRSELFSNQIVAAFPLRPCPVCVPPKMGLALSDGNSYVLSYAGTEPD